MGRERAVIDDYNATGSTAVFTLNRWYIPAAILLLFFALFTVVFAGEPAEKQYGCENGAGVLVSGSNRSDEACEVADSEKPFYRDASTTGEQTKGE